MSHRQAANFARQVIVKLMCDVSRLAAFGGNSDMHQADRIAVFIGFGTSNARNRER